MAKIEQKYKDALLAISGFNYSVSDTRIFIHPWLCLRGISIKNALNKLEKSTYWGLT